MRNHPVVMNKAFAANVGYDDAEDLVRVAAKRGDPESVKAVREIDEARAAARAAAAALNDDMAGRLGLTMDQVAALVAKLVGDPDPEKWLLRRVNLTRASERTLDHDEHHENA
jgi:hypothetical protein